jgi:hypothetical protein
VFRATFLLGSPPVSLARNAMFPNLKWPTTVTTVAAVATVATVNRVRIADSIEVG